MSRPRTSFASLVVPMLMFVACGPTAGGGDDAGNSDAGGEPDAGPTGFALFGVRTDDASTLGIATAFGVERVVTDAATAPRWPGSFVEVNGTILFTADDPTRGRELWTTDGTASGTRPFLDLWPGTEGSNPDFSKVIGTRAFFRADDGTHGSELWVTDGTVAGTRLVKDIAPGEASSNPQPPGVLGDKLYFGAADATGDYELWVSDGTADGTQLLKDLEPVSGNNGAIPTDFTRLGDHLFFAAGGGSGRALWKTDGTADGTVKVKAIYPYTIAAALGRVFIGASDNALWTSDGTEAGTVSLATFADAAPYDLVEYANALYFRGNDGTNGWQLWTSDGTPAGTRIHRKLFDGGDPEVSSLWVSRGTLFFRATDATHGRQLWSTDGTANGTRRRSAVEGGLRVQAGFERMAPYGEVLLRGDLGKTCFFGHDEAHGTEVWCVEGDGDATLLEDFVPGPGDGVGGAG